MNLSHPILLLAALIGGAERETEYGTPSPRLSRREVSNSLFARSRGPDATNHLRLSYAWGLDLTESRDGAGAIGGLVMITDHTCGGTTHFPCYDGKGNMVALVAQDRTLSARYEHGPFAESIRVPGPCARSNPFRWSTKFPDDDTGLIFEYGAKMMFGFGLL